MHCRLQAAAGDTAEPLLLTVVVNCGAPGLLQLLLLLMLYRLQHASCMRMQSVGSPAQIVHDIMPRLLSIHPLHPSIQPVCLP